MNCNTVVKDITILCGYRHFLCIFHLGEKNLHLIRAGFGND